MGLGWNDFDKVRFDCVQCGRCRYICLRTLYIMKVPHVQATSLLYEHYFHGLGPLAPGESGYSFTAFIKHLPATPQQKSKPHI